MATARLARQSVGSGLTLSVGVVCVFEYYMASHGVKTQSKRAWCWGKRWAGVPCFVVRPSRRQASLAPSPSSNVESSHRPKAQKLGV